MNSEDLGNPFSSMQIAEGVDHFQQELTALGIMSGDPFQLEDNFGESAPQLNEDIAGEDIMSTMTDIQSQLTADIVPSVELIPLNDSRPGFGHKCSLCGKRFLTSTWLDKHMAMHVKSEQFSCDKCGAVFSRKNGLYYHQLKEHSDKGPKTVNCKICGKTVGVGGPLTNHLRSHTLSAAHSAAQQYKKKLLKSQITHRKPQEVLKRSVRSLLKCNFCGKTFQRVSSLSNHLRVHTNVKIPNKKHGHNKIVAKEPEVRSVTENLSKFQCHICNKFLVNNIALSNHLRIHGLTLAMKYYKGKRVAPTTLQKYKPLANFQKEKSEVMIRVQKAKPDVTVKAFTYNPSKIYKCKYCGLQFNNKFGMAGHVKAHKAEFMLQSIPGSNAGNFSKPSTSVDDCSTKNYEVSNNENQFMTSEANIGEFSSQNLVRDANFDQNSSRTPAPDLNLTQFSSQNPAPDANADEFTTQDTVPGASVDEFTNSSLLSVKCQICGVEFDSSVSLALHSRKHKRGRGETNAQETYKCLECFTVLASRSGLMRHILMHTGTRMHNCPDCGIRFLQKIHLQRHLTAHQNKFPFKCDLCTATYIEARGMVKHKRMHDDPNWGFVTCAHCKFVFSSNTVLKTHIRARHTGKQAFECNVCRAQFMKNTHLNQHTRLHDIQLKHAEDKRIVGTPPSSQIQKSKHKKRGKSNKKLICGICQHAFGYVCSLKVHMRNIHTQFHCGICLTFVDNKYLSNASGMLHKSVCISCYPGKGKKPKRNSAFNKSQLLFQPEHSLVSQLVGELFSELVDEELLRSEGVLEKPVNQQLHAMVELCGETAVTRTESDVEEGLRENLKRLFSVSVGEDATNELLKCKSIEDVLLGMLSSLHKENIDL